MSSVYIIAEAGVNHNGNLHTAKVLIDAAAEAGADAVKFQTFQAEKLVCKNAVKAAYQKETTDASQSQYEMLKKLELTKQMHLELKEHCCLKKIQFLSTPFDIESMKFLLELDIPIIKISSGEITNYPYLKAAAQTGKDIILSTGMSTMQEVRSAVETLRNHCAGNITVLHCNTQYPTPMQDVNLRAMLAMKEELGVSIGYSDHTEGIEVPVAAAALGASVIEKHFTLDKGLEGPDHKASLEPHELKQMVKSIRNIEQALGSAEKRPSPSETENIAVVRKSIVAAAAIRRGEQFTEKNLTAKRPGTGISPMRWEEVIGKISDRDYEPDDIICL